MRSARKKGVTEMQAEDKRVYEAGQVKETHEREEWRDVEGSRTNFHPLASPPKILEASPRANCF